MMGVDNEKYSPISGFYKKLQTFIIYKIYTLGGIYAVFGGSNGIFLRGCPKNPLQGSSYDGCR